MTKTCLWMGYPKYYIWLIFVTVFSLIFSYKHNDIILSFILYKRGEPKGFLFLIKERKLEQKKESLSQ